MRRVLLSLVSLCLMAASCTTMSSSSNKEWPTVQISFATGLDGNGDPVDHITSISMSEPMVYSYSRLSGFPNGEHTYLCQVFDEAGNLLQESRHAFSKDSVEYFVWTYHRFRVGQEQPGKWKFEIWIDGIKMAREHLVVLPVNPDFIPRLNPEVAIRGGVVRMGDDGETADPNERPAHDVTVRGFFMGVTEVTVGEFRRFVQDTGYVTTAEKNGGAYIGGTIRTTQEDANWNNPYFPQKETNPVTVVSWIDAANYCNWLSEKKGLVPVYDIGTKTVSQDPKANGYRLPTEEEWEFAARGGASAAAGGELAAVDRTSWYDANSNSSPHPVAQKLPNSLGLYDLLGNVWELCNNGSYDYPKPAKSESLALGTTLIVFRGGGWDSVASYLRPSIRHMGTLDSRNRSVGFRVVRSLE